MTQTGAADAFAFCREQNDDCLKKIFRPLDCPRLLPSRTSNVIEIFLPVPFVPTVQNPSLRCRVSVTSPPLSLLPTRFRLAVRTSHASANDHLLDVLGPDRRPGCDPGCAVLEIARPHISVRSATGWQGTGSHQEIFPVKLGNGAELAFAPVWCGILQG